MGAGPLAQRGPVVLGLMVDGLIILATLLWLGRWRPWIRQAEMVHSLAVCIVLTWAVGAGPVRTRRHHVRQAVETASDAR